MSPGKRGSTRDLPFHFDCRRTTLEFGRNDSATAAHSRDGERLSPHYYRQCCAGSRL
jgi:hypothetical protein